MIGPYLVAQWESASRTFRLVRTSPYSTSTLVLERAVKDALGAENWVEVTRSADISTADPNEHAFWLRLLKDMVDSQFIWAEAEE